MLCKFLLCANLSPVCYPEIFSSVTWWMERLLGVAQRLTWPVLGIASVQQERITELSFQKAPYVPCLQIADAKKHEGFESFLSE